MNTASALQLHPSAKVCLDFDAASELTMRDDFDWIQEKNPGAPRMEGRTIIGVRGATREVSLAACDASASLPSDGCANTLF